ncbi:hypothetical protein HDU88_003644 [Geranomyces variabilis]|nr:hypothetical protein HDU88_003644 [Geranomyces variabilis]
MANQNRKRAEAAATRRRQAAKAAADRAATVSKKALKKLNAAAKVPLPAPTHEEDRYFGIGRPAAIVTTASLINKSAVQGSIATGSSNNTLLTPPKSTPPSPTKVAVPTSPTKLVIKTLSFASVIKGASVPTIEPGQHIADEDEATATVGPPPAVSEDEFPSLSPTKRTKAPEWPIKTAASSSWEPSHAPSTTVKIAEAVAPVERKPEAPVTNAVSAPAIRRPRFVTSLKEAGPLSLDDIQRASVPRELNGAKASSTAAPTSQKNEDASSFEATKARPSAAERAESPAFADDHHNERNKPIESNITGSSVSPSSCKDASVAKPDSTIAKETSTTQAVLSDDQPAVSALKEETSVLPAVSFAAAVKNEIASEEPSNVLTTPDATASTSQASQDRAVSPHGIEKSNDLAPSTLEGEASVLPAVSFAAVVKNEIASEERSNVLTTMDATASTSQASQDRAVLPHGIEKSNDLAPSTLEGEASVLPEVSFAAVVKNEIASEQPTSVRTAPDAAASASQASQDRAVSSHDIEQSNEDTMKPSVAVSELASASTEPKNATVEAAHSHVVVPELSFAAAVNNGQDVDPAASVKDADEFNIESVIVAESDTAGTSTDISEPVSPSRRVKPTVSFADVAKGDIPEISHESDSANTKTVGTRTDSGTCVDDVQKEPTADNSTDATTIAATVLEQHDTTEAATASPAAEQPNKLLKTIYSTAKAHPVLSYGAGACVAATWLPVVLITSPITVPCAISSAFTYKYLLPDRLKRPVRAVASAVRRQHDLCAAAL